MPRYERPENSSLGDFPEHDTATAWGAEDDIEDMRPEDRDYEGFHPPLPGRPDVGEPRSSGQSVLGSRKDGSGPDAYYQQKIEQGLIDPPKSS